jgi:hypothetical protein
MENIERIIGILQEDTPSEHVRFLPKAMKHQGEKHTALAIPYVDIAFVRQRLDDACGPFGWQLEAKEINGLSFAGIGILNPDTDEWIWRWDTGQDEPWEVISEGEKLSMTARSVFSISIKRAAYNWGIGKDVNAMRCFRCECNVWGDKKKFSSWVENPLVKQVEHMRNRQALPAASSAKNGPLTGMKPAVEGGSELTKFADDDARRIHEQCKEAAKFSCGMTKEEFDPIFKDFEDDGGCRVETYMDLFNYLQDYRRTKLKLAKMLEPEFTDVNMIEHSSVLKSMEDVSPA